MLYELHLFAGGGGGILAGQLLGHTTVCAVEIEPYARAILCARQDDRTFPAFPIWDDVRSFRSDNPECAECFAVLRGLADRLVICGGFPCQDISAAGKGAGLGGAKSSLFYEYLRIVRELRPSYVFMENSPIITSRGLDAVLSGLAEIGYDAEWCVLGADDVWAPHIRKRWWCLAHASGEGRRQDVRGSHGDEGAATGRGTDEAHQPRSDGEGSRSGEVADANHQQLKSPMPFGGEESMGGDTSCVGGQSAGEASGCGGVLADAESPKRIESHMVGSRTETAITKPSNHGRHAGWGHWPPEPNVGRVAARVAYRSHRLAALGNGQVPQCAAAAFAHLWDRIHH